MTPRFHSSKSTIVEIPPRLSLLDIGPRVYRAGPVPWLLLGQLITQPTGLKAPVHHVLDCGVGQSAYALGSNPESVLELVCELFKFERVRSTLWVGRTMSISLSDGRSL